ncbi:MAG: S41 family peptidase [Firmicutes bacterium]|nr:S41 family peptidase [Bacillota bacterium]
MFIKKPVFILLLVAALLLGGSAVLLVGKLGVSDAVVMTAEEYEDYNYLISTYGKMDKLKEMVENTYYIKVDSEKLMENAYSGLVAGLEDPYSEYISAKDYENYMASMLGSYSGVGMSFYNNEDSVLEVIQVYKGSPAEAAGMKPGDIILEVDGKAFTGPESTEAAAAIRGKEGTSVTVKYRRNGKEDSVTMVRAQITVQTIEYEMLEGSIGYIQIDSFESATGADFKAALDDLTQQGAKGLVIDLRNNGGGLVNEAIKVADELMNQGTVVYTEDHNGKRDYYTTESGRTALPYVLLVNEYTASASEILAAGIQDNKEGQIVGTKTFGKGIIQSIYPMFDDGSAVKLTTMQYFSASGNTIHKVGITPDHVVELKEGDNTDYQLRKALEVLK